MDGWNTVCWGFHSMSTFLLPFQGVFCFLFGSSESLWIFAIQSLRSRGIAIISMTWTALPGALPGASFRCFFLCFFLSHGCHKSYLAREQHNYQTWKKTYISYISNIKTTTKIRILTKHQKIKIKITTFTTFWPKTRQKSDKWCVTNKSSLFSQKKGSSSAAKPSWRTGWWFDDGVVFVMGRTHPRWWCFGVFCYGIYGI